MRPHQQGKLEQIIQMSKNYYEAGKNVLARQVYVDWPREIAKGFKSTKRSQLRRFYDRVLSARLLLRAQPDKAEAILRSAMGDLIRQAKYQESRGVIEPNVSQFLVEHAKHVDTNKELFEGFYQLFQSLMAYLPR